VAKQGIIIGAIAYNVSAYNIFLNVGNDFLGAGNASAAIIDISGDNNVSIGDMFERSDADNLIQPRIDLNNKACYALINGEEIEFGTYHKLAGVSTSLTTTASPTTIFTVKTDNANAFNCLYYGRNPITNVLRFGTLRVVAQDSDDSSGTLAYVDDYSEDNPSQFVLDVVQSGSTISVRYTSTADFTFKYSLEHLGT
jgi:hypothetical protein